MCAEAANESDPMFSSDSLTPSLCGEMGIYWRQNMNKKWQSVKAVVSLRPE